MKLFHELCCDVTKERVARGLQWEFLTSRHGDGDVSLSLEGEQGQPGKEEEGCIPGGMNICRRGAWNGVFQEARCTQSSCVDSKQES